MTPSDNSRGNSSSGGGGGSISNSPNASPSKGKRFSSRSISTASKRVGKQKMIILLEHGSEDTWTWSHKNCSKEVILSGHKDRTVHFHPNWSRGTAGVRGERPLNNGRFYWELHVTQRIYGTSIMFGIGTKFARLNSDLFTNILGEDSQSWGFSHKGVVWHKGVPLLYADRFQENQPTVVGILFDGIDGTLTYYKDGFCLGVAFRDLDKVLQPLYPMVCSTAAKTEMTLKNTRSDIGRLQDRCRAVILRHVKSRKDLIKLKLPSILIKYLSEGLCQSSELTPITDYRLMFDL